MIEHSCKICRREGEKLFLKGEKCSSPKCPFARRSYPPGQHGSQYKSLTDFGKQLREKQKAKRIYQLRESQFKNYYKKAARKQGDTSDLFLSFLERRLDNVVYKLGFSPSRRQARQMISHGKILVNNKKVDIPSYLVKSNDKIKVQSLPVEISKEINIPSWLKLDRTKKIGQVLHLPTKSEIDTNVDWAQIIEYYSR